MASGGTKSGKRGSIQAMLEEELRRLKERTGLDGGLAVRWEPDPGSEKHGEVRRSVIVVHDGDPEEAIRTLRHEFLDYHVTKGVVEPLIQYVNMQKRLIEALIYERKEGLIKGLEKLCSEEGSA